MLHAAREAHLDELGISDHFAVMPTDLEQGWSLQQNEIGQYVDELQLRGGEAESPVMRIGIEIDFFPETIDRVKQILAQHPFDYIIGSVHYVDDFPVDACESYWTGLTPDQAHEKWQKYWVRVRQLAESGAADFVGHLDLPKKFGYAIPSDVIPFAEQALDAIAEADIAIEINTSGWRVKANEAYPSPQLLQSACRRGIPLVINADAHQPQFVASHFGRARDLAWQAGFRSLVRFEKRERIPVPLQLHA